eukprot:365697-Chlamydomonas_euryale.AAC.7
MLASQHETTHRTCWQQVTHDDFFNRHHQLVSCKRHRIGYHLLSRCRVCLLVVGIYPATQVAATASHSIATVKVRLDAVAIALPALLYQAWIPLAKVIILQVAIPAPSEQIQRVGLATFSWKHNMHNVCHVCQEAYHGTTFSPAFAAIICWTRAANSSAVSLSRLFWGSRNQTSQTRAHDVMILTCMPQRCGQIRRTKQHSHGWREPQPSCVSAFGAQTALPHQVAAK